jgi:hypothetical protein
MELSDFHPDDLVSELEASGNVIIGDDKLQILAEHYKETYARGHGDGLKRGIAKGIRFVMIDYLGFSEDKMLEFEAEADADAEETARRMN